MVTVYLLVGLVAGTGASIYAYVVLDASFWMALAIYAGAGNISVIATALCALLLHSREQSRRAVPSFSSTRNGEGATSWDVPVESLRTTDSRAA